MLNNVILDIFIGLIFVFLLYSLLASIVQELIAHRMNLRARMLQKAIRKMLEDQASPTGTPWQRSTFYNYFAEIWETIRRFFRPFRDYEKFARNFYDHPSVKYLGEDKSYSKPAYLQPHNFSHTIIQLLRGKEFDGSTSNEAELIKNTLDNNTLNINEETLSHLRDLFADARQDAYHFRKRLEQWFDETMQRTGGWYKRQTQMILVVIGFAMAWIFNVDAIAITRILAKDKKVREQMVEMAISRKDQYKPIVDTVRVLTVQNKAGVPDTVETTKYDTTYETENKYFDSVYQVLRADASLTQNILGLSVKIPDSVQKAYQDSIVQFDQLIAGAPDAATKKELKNDKQKLEKRYKQLSVHPYQQKGWLKVLGWLITAWAISLGAPFWFDLLNKFIQLRSSGQRVPTGIDTGKDALASGKTSDGKTIRG